jgi:hypothetical protein
MANLEGKEVKIIKDDDLVQVYTAKGKKPVVVRGKVVTRTSPKGLKIAALG